MMKKIFSLVFFLVLCSPAYSQVRVYVYPKATEGFVESSRIPDTLKDLQDQISKRKDMRLTEDKDSAVVLLELVNSGPVAVGTQADTRVRAGIFGGVNSTTTTTGKTLPNITVILHVRNSDYQKEIAITQQLFWKDMAKRIVNQVGDWIKVNGAKLNP